MNERLRLLAWQIDVMAYERDNEGRFPERFASHEAKWGSPWPAFARRIHALIGRGDGRPTNISKRARVD